MPLQKYGFHGLSYASIVDSVAKHLKKPSNEVDIVVAHLGSGASAACIQGGKSIDTSKLVLFHCFLGTS
jgi:acetate kinase